MIKVMYVRPTANTILIRKQFQDFLPFSVTRQGCPFSPLLFNAVFETLVKATKQEKEIVI